MKKKLMCILCSCVCVLLLIGYGGTNTYGNEEDYSSDDIFELCEDIIDWASSDGNFLNEDFVSGAGTNANDWLFIGYCRLLGLEGTEAYLEELENYVEDMYASGNLENTKATEWHRVGLALLAAGADPCSFGVDADGNSIDLVADGTYNHAQYSSLGRQGVNGWCFALIFMDASGVEIPEGANYTREYIITQILSEQLANGGFSLTGASDPDVTAIAVQALAPYYEDEDIYTFESDDETVSKTVKEAVDAAVSWLSIAQLDDGGFSSYGTENAESTAQVVLALTCLDIDPLTDERFIKNGNSCIDGLLRYRTESGGFAHILSDDGTAVNENGLASAQSLCALVALYREMSGMSDFYDFSDEEETSVIENGETTEARDTEEETETDAVTDSEEDTSAQTEVEKTDDTSANDMSEAQETISEVSEEESELPENFAYIIAGIAIALGIISYVVMRIIGIKDDKTTSE